jgi:hypothetical protein
MNPQKLCTICLFSGVLFLLCCQATNPNGTVSNTTDGGSGDGAPPTSEDRDNSDGSSYDIPANAGIVNVRDYGAKGDGSTDDTAAFAMAINTNFNYCGGDKGNFRFVYVPNGTYLVSDQIFWQRWLTFQGQSETGTIIKLKDNAVGFQDRNAPKAVIRTRFLGNACSPFDGNNNSSFSNYIQNLTVDVGAGNPGAIGVVYNNHNGGAMRNVTIKATDQGVTGLDLSETEFGPGLIKSVTIDNFDRGIATPGNVSHATMEHITVKNCQIGLQNYLPVSIHDFHSVNNKVGITNGGGSVLAQLVLINAQFEGGNGAALAIDNTGNGTMHLRNISQTGHTAILSDQGRINTSASIDSYLAGEKLQLGTAPTAPMALPIKTPPAVFEEPSNQWVFIDPSADDDTATIQAAIDGGAKTIYFAFGGNYSVSGTVVIRGQLQRMLGFGASINSSTSPIFRVENSLPLTVEFLGTNSYPNTLQHVEFANTGPVFWKSSGSYLGYMGNTVGASGDLFFEDSHQPRRMMFPQNLWMRHWNVENNPADATSTLVYGLNNGGNWWILGLKTEGIATHVETAGGGKSEILGGFFRDHVNAATVPYFSTADSCVSATFYTYDYAGCGNSRGFYARETKNGVMTDLQLTSCARNVALYAGCSQ